MFLRRACLLFLAALILPASSLRLPIAISLDAFLAQAERDIPITHEGRWEILTPRALGRPVKVPLATRYFLERGAILAEGQGDRLLLRLPIRYRVELGIPKVETNLALGWKTIATCKPDRPAVILLESRIRVDADWHLAAHSEPRIDSLEPCRLAALKEKISLDVTPQVRYAFAAGLTEAARQLDRQVAQRADLPRIAGEVWRRLHSPVALDERNFLYLRPDSARLATPVFVSREIRTGIVLEGALALLTESSSSATPPPLPPLSLTGPIDSLSLDLSLSLPLDEANTRLADSVRGLPIKTKNGRRLRLDDLRFAAIGERLIIEAEVSGDFKGRLSFSGTPRLDPATGILAIEGLRYTLDTDSVLVRFASWLRHDAYRRQFEQAARLSLPELLNRQKERLEANLRQSFSGPLSLTGRLDSVDYGRLAVSNGNVILEGRARGNVILDVQGW